MTDRIGAILAMLEKSPDDTFLYYSLGMEYAAAGRFDQAVEHLKKCIELDADYLPAYVEAGKCLRSAGRLAEARQIFTQAMELACRLGQGHTRDFIKQQFDGLPRA